MFAPSACVPRSGSSGNITRRSKPSGDENKLPEKQTPGSPSPNHTNHLPCNEDVCLQFVDSFTYLGSLITNDGSRNITPRTVALPRLLPQTASAQPFCFMVSSRGPTTFADRHVLPMRHLRVCWHPHTRNQNIRESTKKPTVPSFLLHRRLAGSDIAFNCRLF